MATSIFLARLIGPFVLVLGLAVLLDKAFVGIATEFMASPALIFLSGAITLPVGLAIVLTHNVWTPDWRVLITLLGWLALIAGLARMLMPQRLAPFGKSFLRRPNALRIGAGGYVLVGALLCFFGYRH